MNKGIHYGSVVGLLVFIIMISIWQIHADLKQLILEIFCVNKTIRQRQQVLIVTINGLCVMGDCSSNNHYIRFKCFPCSARSVWVQ